MVAGAAAYGLLVALLGVPEWRSFRERLGRRFHNSRG